MNGEWELPGISFLKSYRAGLALEAKLFQQDFDKPIAITREAIKKIPYIEYPDLTQQQCITLAKLERKLLTISQMKNNHREVTITLRLDNENFSNQSEQMAIVLGSEHEVDLMFDAKTYHLISSAKDLVVVNLHNHPSTSTFSTNDIVFFLEHQSIKLMILLTNKGKIEFISKNKNYKLNEAVKFYNDLLLELQKKKQNKNGYLDIKSITNSDVLDISKKWLFNASKFGIIYGDAKKYTMKRAGGR